MTTHTPHSMNRRQIAARVLICAAGIAFNFANTPPAFAAGAFDKGLTEYKAFIVDQITTARDGAKKLQAALKANDVKAAQEAWIASRAGWERAEPITGAFFSELDEAIDAWPDATKGYHAIEARIFAGKTDEVPALADGLVEKLNEFHVAVSVASFSFNAQGVYDGLTKLVYEIGENKAKGGESQFAGTSLKDMKNNVVGIEAAYEMVFRAALKAKDEKLAHDIHEGIEAVEDLVKVETLAKLDQAKLREESEKLAVLLKRAAPKIGLKAPVLGE